MRLLFLAAEASPAPSAASVRAPKKVNLFMVYPPTLFFSHSILTYGKAYRSPSMSAILTILMYVRRDRPGSDMSRLDLPGRILLVCRHEAIAAHRPGGGACARMTAP